MGLTPEEGQSYDPRTAPLLAIYVTISLLEEEHFILEQSPGLGCHGSQAGRLEMVALQQRRESQPPPPAIADKENPGCDTWDGCGELVL
jgi:hypothetical protein